MAVDMSTLPEALEGPRAWRGVDMASDPDRWLSTLNEAEVADLEQAARHYLSLGRDIGEITKEAFPITVFSQRIEPLKQTLLHGVGVQVIRGLPVANYSQALAATIFCGIGAHVGSARSQNADGHILGHVRDVGRSPDDPNTRIYQTSARQTFHTDSADVVGLLCLREAMEGGKSLLVSASTIYNRMRREHPSLLPLLFDPIATDRRGEVPEGYDPFMTIPPLSWYQDALTVFYQRQYIDSSQRFPDAMRLSADHVAALDLFDQYADDPEMHFGMQLQPGDIQFVYNHGFLHDRTGFKDWPEDRQKRHLLRLWLSLEGDRPLPPCFAQRYGSLEIGKRGGIITKHTKLHAPID